MLLIDDTYFIGEISVPNLPSSRMADEFAYFGSARMTQTAGENNLLTFIDNKVTEYLVSMFGEELTDTLIQEWYDYKQETEKNKATLLTIQNTIEPNKWVSYDVNEDIDIMFSEFEVADFTFDSEERFGSARTFVFIKDDTKLRIRVKDNQTDSVLINVNNIDFASIEVLHVVSLSLPSKPIRALLNLILTYNGNSKVSPAANYVYFWLNRDASNGTTAMGEADLNFSRASSAYEADKFIKINAMRNRLIRSWNAMIPLNRKIYTHVFLNVSDYPNADFSNSKNMTTKINTFNV